MKNSNETFIVENYQSKSILQMSKELNTSYYLLNKEFDELEKAGLVARNLYLNKKEKTLTPKGEKAKIYYFDAEKFVVTDDSFNEEKKQEDDKKLRLSEIAKKAAKKRRENRENGIVPKSKNKKRVGRPRKRGPKKGSKRIVEVISNTPKLKSQETASNKIFTNYFGEGKLKAREFISGVINKTELKSGIVVCLPAEFSILEKKIHEEVSKSFIFLACERRIDIFKTMIETSQKLELPLFARLGELRDTIYSLTENSLSHAILDYCGFLTTFTDEIEYIVKNKIVKIGGTIITTVMKARNKGILDKTGIQKATKNMTKTERAIKKYFKNIDGYEYVADFQYTDSSPMMVVAIKRVK